MKKKKNRPLFPNGYNVKKKVKVTVPKVRLSKNTQRSLDVIKNAYSKMYEKFNYNANKYNNLLQERNVMVKNNLPVGLIQHQDIKLEKWKDITNANKLVKENLMRRLEEWQKTGVSFGKYLRAKNMAIFEDWWNVNLTKNSAGQLVYDEDTRQRQMILQGLINRGYNMFDPTIVRDTLKGLAPDDIYYVWIFRHEDEDYYEAFFNHMEDTIDEVLDEITSPGFDIQHYKDYREIILNATKSRFD